MFTYFERYNRAKYAHEFALWNILRRHQEQQRSFFIWINESDWAFVSPAKIALSRVRCDRNSTLKRHYLHAICLPTDIFDSYDHIMARVLVQRPGELVLQPCVISMYRYDQFMFELLINNRRIHITSLTNETRQPNHFYQYEVFKEF